MVRCPHISLDVLIRLVTRSVVSLGGRCSAQDENWFCCTAGRRGGTTGFASRWSAGAQAMAFSQGFPKASRSYTAELADHGSLEQGRPVGLRRAGGRGGHEEHPRRRGPEAVKLQHHASHERLHRLGQQRHAGHGGRQLRRPALPRHRAAALTSELASRDASISGPRTPCRDASILALQGAKADATLLASYAKNALQGAQRKKLAALHRRPGRASRLGSSFAEAT